MKLYGRGIWIFWEHESAFSYHGLTACAATIVMQLRRDQDMNTRVEHESVVYLALVDTWQCWETTSFEALALHPYQFWILA